jgi:hypothetical protein
LKTDKPITIFSSNSPMDCYILKGRLETEGIKSYIFDEYVVWVHPFRAQAVGGVKLKVKSSQVDSAFKTMNLLKANKLVDNNGEYPLDSTFQEEFLKQNEILNLKSKLRNKPELLIKGIDKLNIPDSLSKTDLEKLTKEEKSFQRLQRIKHRFNWKKLLYELFDPRGRGFHYLRTRSPEFYIEKELVENFQKRAKEDEIISNCPNCQSDNVSFGVAIDFKWDIIYLILSIVLMTPAPLIRRKNHCFKCGTDFDR